MKLKKYSHLHAFLATNIANAEMDADEQATRNFIATAPVDRQQQVINEAKKFIADLEFPLEELGSEANRWFGDEEEARAWLRQIIAILEGSQNNQTSISVIVKDSNGTVLAEGDSVTVIKDLKVKGGSSDLKRGALIKNIRLTSDPENIECRVNGSTLVLKTCFLKKA